MSARVVTVVDATIAQDREQELLDGFEQMNEQAKPAGLLASELLRGQNGAWRIQTVWQDRDALMAVRASGEPPAALALLDRLGVEHSHGLFTVEQSYNAG
jgi:hypothetical protein